MSKDSWQEFFDGLTLEIMQEARPDEEISAEIRSMVRLLGLREGDRVLDVPCGSGRHSALLASAGCKVTGLDISEPLLRKAREDTAASGMSIEYQQGDMRALPWRDQFDAAVCLWGSFGYFDDEGNAAYLRAVFRALKPGGRFLIDTPIVETVLPGYRASDWTQIGRTMLLETRRYDHINGRIDRSWTMMQGKKVEKRTLSMRLHTYRELCNMLCAAGFASCEGYSTLAGAPYALGGDRVYMLATKGD
jgi:SAM-dependent methyltransferase